MLFVFQMNGSTTTTNDDDDDKFESIWHIIQIPYILDIRKKNRSIDHNDDNRKKQ